MKKLIIFFAFFFVTIMAFAQSAENDMAVDLRSSGKIYVVVAVIVLIFIGIAIYLFSIDRRIKKIEKRD